MDGKKILEKRKGLTLTWTIALIVFSIYWIGILASNAVFSFHWTHDSKNWLTSWTFF